MRFSKKLNDTQDTSGLTKKNICIFLEQFKKEKNQRKNLKQHWEC